MFGRFGISSVYSIVTLHTAELFPTEIRGSALGACSTMAHIGSMTAPFVVDFLVKQSQFIYVFRYYNKHFLFLGQNRMVHSDYNLWSDDFRGRFTHPGVARN